MPQPQTILHACTADVLVEERATLRVYVSTMHDKKGGDLPGGASGRVCWIVLDTTSSEVNVVDRRWAEDMRGALKIVKNSNVGAVVIASGKKSGFGVGRDVQKCYETTEKQQIIDDGVYVRETLLMLRALSITTISVVHGSCLGASFEIALATKIRVGVEGAHIGFNEVKIGMLPHHTGVAHLVELMGTRSAIGLIVKSRILSTHVAFDLNIVDYLLEVAAELDTLLWSVLTQSDLIELRRGLKRNDWVAQSTSLGKLFMRYEAGLMSASLTDGQRLAADAILCATYYGKKRGMDHVLNCGAELQLTENSKLSMKNWLCTRDVIDATKQVRTDVNFEEKARKSMVVVGPTRQVAVALSTAIKKGVFATLCGLGTGCRVAVIDEMVGLLDETAQEILLPRLDKTNDMDTEGVPTSSGYGMVGVVVDGERPGSEKLLEKIRGEKDSHWEWVACDQKSSMMLGSLRIPHTEAALHHSSISRSPAVDVVADDSHPTVAKFVSLGFLTFPVQNKVSMIVSALDTSRQTALTTSGMSPHMAGLPTRHDCGTSQAHFDAFLTTLTSNILKLSTTSPPWVTPSILDSLFITCLGWAPGSSPLTEFDRRGLKSTDKAKEDEFLRSYFEAHEKALPTHPEVPDSEQHLAAVRSFGNTFTILPSLWDLVWPVVAYLAAQGVLMLLAVVLEKWAEFRSFAQQ